VDSVRRRIASIGGMSAMSVRYGSRTANISLKPGAEVWLNSDLQLIRP
jgi:hypothetical protein